MDDIKVFSVLCRPVQNQTIERWQCATGSDVERHYSLPAFKNACTDYKKAIVFVGWPPPRHRNRPVQAIIQIRKEISHGSYLIALSRTDDELDVKNALELGADRLIRTDVSLRLLTGLIGAIARRLSSSNTVFHLPPYTLNRMTRVVSVVDENIQLSPLEFRLTQYLFENTGRALAHATLLHHVWELPDLNFPRRVDTQMSIIRNKVKLDGRYGWSLKNARGQGYTLFNNNHRSLSTPFQLSVGL